MIVRHDDAHKVMLDRVSEESLLRTILTVLFLFFIGLLANADYLKTVIKVKVWAFYDKTRGELSLDTLFADEEPIM